MMEGATDSICVIPLSSPYALFPRIHTYLLAAALLAPLPNGWIFKASLAACTTRTAVFAVDAIVALARLRRQDPHTSEAHLDVLPATEALGLASLVGAWLLLVSSKLDESKARSLIRCWTATVGVGSIVAFVACVLIGKISGDGDGACHGAHMLRDDVLGANENALVLGSLGSKIKWFCYRVGVPGLLSGSLALLSILKPRPRTSRESLVGTESSPKTPLQAREHDRAWSDNLLGVLLRYLSWAAFPTAGIFMMVSTEQYFHYVAKGIPSAEPITSIGQWSVWAATGVVLFAAFVNGFAVMTGMRPEENGDADEPKGSQSVVSSV